MVPMAPTDLDRLYQLPLGEFTAERNALAKKAGTNAGAIRALTKPPLAAWAVNQLYWRNRRAWDALIEASEHQRRTNKAVLAGRAGDVRAAGQVHDEAVHDALKATLEILTREGQPATDATKQAILYTLRALPGDEAPGRLTKTLQPGGFELLAGITMGTKAAGATKATKEPTKGQAQEPKKDRAKNDAQSKADAKALTQAREAAASAERALKDAEQAVRRHEFEIARATRDEERAEKAVAQARAGLEEAKTALASAQRDQVDATARRETAEAAAKKAGAAVETARRAATAAQAAVKKL